MIWFNHSSQYYYQILKIEILFKLFQVNEYTTDIVYCLYKDLEHITSLAIVRLIVMSQSCIVISAVSAMKPICRLKWVA